MLLTDDVLDAMADLGPPTRYRCQSHRRPRAGWGHRRHGLTSAGKIVALRAPRDGSNCSSGRKCQTRRMESRDYQRPRHTMRDAVVLGKMKEAALSFPQELISEGSVMLGAANPASVRMLQDLGLTTFNTPTDLSLAQLAAIRAATTMPLDIYVEVPDDIGGFVRHYEIAELVRVCAPVYLKFGLRNAPNIYPAGTHLESTAIALTRERLRRARIGYDMLKRLDPDAIMSPLPEATTV